MNKRMLMLGALVLAFGLLLSACAPAAPAGGGTVTLWHAYQTGSAEETTLMGLIESAEMETGYTIEVLQVPFDQIFNKWQVEVAAGGGPDMFVAPNDDLGNWVRGGLVADITAMVSAEDLAGVSETGVAGMTVDGKLYGIPESAKAVALYYNTSLVDTPPATTDEFLAAIEGGAPTTFFIGAYHMFGWSGAFGGELLDAEGKCIADQGGWADMLDFLRAAQAAGATFTTDYGQAEAPFRAGETAFFVNGPWALGDYKNDLGDNLGVAVMPAGTGNANPLNGIDGFYINPNSANMEGAVAVGVYLSSGASAQSYTDNAGHVPIRDSVDASDPLVATFAQASAQGFPRPQSTFFANYWGPFGDMFTKAFETDTPSADLVSEACAGMNSANGF